MTRSPMMPHTDAHDARARRYGLAPLRADRPGTEAAARRPPVAMFGLAVGLLLCLGVGPNLDLAVLAVIVLVVGCVALWRPGESPVLILTFVLHWLGASVAVFHANWLDIDLFRYATFGGDMHLATVLSLVGVLCVALGMRCGAGGWRPGEADAARSIALAQPVARWFSLYCQTWAFSLAMLSLVWFLPGLAQLLLAAAALRWASYFVLAYAAFVRGGLTSPYLLAAGRSRGRDRGGAGRRSPAAAIGACRTAPGRGCRSARTSTGRWSQTRLGCEGRSAAASRPQRLQGSCPLA